MNGKQTEECKRQFQKVYSDLIIAIANNEQRAILEIMRKDFYALRDSYLATGVDPLLMITWAQDARIGCNHDAA